MITIQKTLQDFRTTGHSIEDLGKLVQGKRFFLAHNSKAGWYLRSFDMGFFGRLSLILRSLFGFYRDTHMNHVLGQLDREVSSVKGDRDLSLLYRTLRVHWHRSTPFPWKIDTCINCFAKECFKKLNSPFCTRGCAHQFKQQPRPIGMVAPKSPPQAVQPVRQDIVSGYSFDRMRGELIDYAKRGYVDFYNEKKPLTSIFGNFHPCPVTVTIGGNSYTFACAEAAFQAHKFAHNPALIQQFTVLQGDASWRLARTHASQQSPDWQQGVNVAAMRAVLAAKFSNPQLKDLLLATGSAILVEHTPPGRDKFWGDNGDGTGQNQLGVLLMELRARHLCIPLDLRGVNYRQIAASL